MVTVICIVCFQIVTLSLIFISAKRAPLDTELWGPEALIMDCDSQTRREILDRHPELVEAIDQYRSTGIWSLPAETISAVIKIRDTVYPKHS